MPAAVATIFCLITIAGKAAPRCLAQERIYKPGEDTPVDLFPPSATVSLVSMLIYRGIKFSHPVFDTAWNLCSIFQSQSRLPSNADVPLSPPFHPVYPPYTPATRVSVHRQGDLYSRHITVFR